MQDEFRELNGNALKEAIEGNAVEGCLDWAAWGELALHETRELTWTITSIPFPLFNNVLRAQFDDKGQDALDERIRAVMAPYTQKSLPFAWWLGPSTRPSNLGDRLEALGMNHGATMVGMATDLQEIRGTAPLPKGLEIEEVVIPSTLETWCAVIGEVYNFPDLAQGPWRQLHEAMGLGPGKRWRHFLGVLDGRPVATSSLFLGKGAASVASIATARDLQGRGIGTALSLYPLIEARHQGYQIATLCSSQAAVGVYRRLGFKQHCELDLFLAH